MRMVREQLRQAQVRSWSVTGPGTVRVRVSAVDVSGLASLMS